MGYVGERCPAPMVPRKRCTIDESVRASEAIADRENRSAITIGKEMAFEPHAVEGDPMLVLLKPSIA